MNWLDIFKSIVDVVKAGYKAARNIPHVTCDVKGLYKARWSPDSFHDENGNTIAEGIRIETAGTILLANSGSLDTTVKDVHVVCMSGKKILGQLQCDYESSLSGVIIKPRRIWGPKTIRIEGSLWGIGEPPKDLEAELVIEVVSQRPIKKKIGLYL